MTMKTILAAAAILLTGLAQVAYADPYDNLACSSTSHASTIQCLTIAGPASITHKSLLGAGVGVCTDPTGALSPIPCSTPGAIAGAGAAIFDVSGYANGNHRVDTWVQYNNDGPCQPITTTCGFEILLCNDRDYDSTCTNVNDISDQLRSTQSNEPLVGEDCTNGDKDAKDCGDDLDAETGACMVPAEAAVGADWNNGQIIVFVGAWADSWPGALGSPTNVGAGVAAGTFDVWLQDSGTCTPPQCDDKADNDSDTFVDGDDTNCLSLDDNTENVGGVQPFSCKMVRTIDAVNGDLITTQNCGAAGSCATVGAAGAAIRTVTCTVADACNGGAATLLESDTTVSTTAACGATAVTTSWSPAGSAWKCEVAFDNTAGAAVYAAAGVCQQS